MQSLKVTWRRGCFAQQIVKVFITRRLVTVPSTFQLLQFVGSILNSLLVGITIMISKKCAIVGDQVLY